MLKSKLNVCSRQCVESLFIFAVYKIRIGGLWSVEIVKFVLSSKRRNINFYQSIVSSSP